MKDDNIIMKLYNNPCCWEYDDQDCYLLYISNIGIYISTEEDTFKLEQQIIPDIDIMEEDSMDKYASVRGFKLVAKFKDKKHIYWYNGYDKEKEIVKKRLMNVLTRLRIKLKFGPTNDNTLKTIYTIMSLIIKLI